MILELLRNVRSKGFAESSGFYSRVPIRVGEYTLVENDEGRVVFETTAREHCDEGPKIKVTISDDGGWSVQASQGTYAWDVAPSVDLSREKTARRRAFWHAAQYMAGRELNYKETFSLRRQTEEEADLFKDDAFFRDGDAVTGDPFDEFLER